MAPSYDDPQKFPMAEGPPSAQRVVKKRKKSRIHHRPRSSITSGATRSEINVTPLVDVVLVLLIIFMVVAPLLHRGIPIELPTTAHHDQLQDTGEQLIISVGKSGIFIDQEKIGETPVVVLKDGQRELKYAAAGGEGEKAIAASDMDSLITRFKKDLHDGARPAFVRADKSLDYGQVRFVLQQLHNAGAGTVSMQTEEHK